MSLVIPAVRFFPFSMQSMSLLIFSWFYLDMSRVLDIWLKDMRGQRTFRHFYSMFRSFLSCFLLFLCPLFFALSTRPSIPSFSEYSIFLYFDRFRGQPGVVLVTSGPGATNVITPMQDALSDGVPMIVFSGQVPTSAIGTDAFQEADVVGISRACTKVSSFMDVWFIFFITF
jgi:hypothetical protein